MHLQTSLFGDRTVIRFSHIYGTLVYRWQNCNGSMGADGVIDYNIQALRFPVFGKFPVVPYY